MRRVGGLRYTAACGWELEVRHAAVWPQKPHEPGPPHGERCHTCAEVEEHVNLTAQTPIEIDESRQEH